MNNEMMSESTKRTEELASEISLKVGYFGVGNAGSQIGLELYKAGFPVKIANTSIKDLHGKLIPEGIEAFLIEDSAAQSRGAGRNRRTAKSLYKEWNQKALLFENEDFMNFMSEKDIIFVGSSTAGGTGSGISVALAYQLAQVFPSKVIILIAVIPRLSESVTCQNNTLDYFDEVTKLNGMGTCNIPYMVYDLEKYASMNADEAYEKIARDITSAVGVISGQRSQLTEHGMIDERDMLTAITAPGMLSIYIKDKIDLNKVEGTGIQALLLKDVRTSSVVQPQRDKISSYFACFLDIQDESEDPTKKNDFTELTDYFGRPLDIFVNMKVSNSAYSNIALIVSGLSVPADRLEQCNEIVKEYESKRKAKEYDIASSADSHRALTINNQLDKLMGSSGKTAATSVEDIDVPDFLL